MTAHRSLAAALGARVRERIATDRMINSDNINEAIFDGLVLHAAKGEPQRTVSQEVYDAAVELISMVISDTMLLTGTPRKVSNAIEKIYRALLRGGWTP